MGDFIKDENVWITKILFLGFYIFLSVAAEASFSFRQFHGTELRSGEKVQLDLKSKDVLVVYFLSSSCPCSQRHFDHLNKLQKKYKQFGFVGLHSNAGTSLEQAMKYFSRFEINFPVLLDNHLQYANLFGAVKTPHVFIVSKEGALLFQGGVTDSRDFSRAKIFYLSDALNDLASGREIKEKKAKTLGCYIQR